MKAASEEKQLWTDLFDGSSISSRIKRCKADVSSVASFLLSYT